jgi:hypothetical protein
VTATIGTLAGKSTDPVCPPRIERNRQSARPPVKRTPFDTTLLEDGTRLTVESVEVDGDAVVLGLNVARQAEGARSAPPERLYQVFTVSGAQVVEVRFYPDRASALLRPRS